MDCSESCTSCKSSFTKASRYLHHRCTKRKKLGRSIKERRKAIRETVNGSLRQARTLRVHNRLRTEADNIAVEAVGRNPGWTDSNSTAAPRSLSQSHNTADLEHTVALPDDAQTGVEASYSNAAFSNGMTISTTNIVEHRSREEYGSKAPSMYTFPGDSGGYGTRAPVIDWGITFGTAPVMDSGIIYGTRAPVMDWGMHGTRAPVMDSRMTFGTRAPAMGSGMGIGTRAPVMDSGITFGTRAPIIGSFESAPFQSKHSGG